MKTEVRNITPKIAEELLKLNKSNRPLNNKTVAMYAKDMKRGSWKAETGEAIKISRNKVLLDGQHRLNGVLKANVPVEFLVISDLEDEIFSVLDTGKGRTAADVLSISGVKNPGTVSAISRFILNYENGIYQSKHNDRTNKPTNEDIRLFVEGHEELLEITAFVHDLTKKFKLLPASAIGGMYYIFQKLNVTDADKFVTKLTTGLDLEQDCPIRQFRERLIRDSINKSRMTFKEKIALMVTAWNHFRKGHNIKQLKPVSSPKLTAI